MASSIGLFANLDDYQSLHEYAKSIGLQLVPMLKGEEPPADPAAKPFCYLSSLPPSELHAYGNPAQFSYGRDPLLLFKRPFYQEPYLVAGFVQWSTDNKAFAEVTKPYYQKLSRWVRKEWTKMPNGFYAGPQARELAAQGAKMVDLLPGTATLSVVGV
jgi:hypothetical protein